MQPDDYHDRLVAELLAQVFGTLDAAALALLREHLRWLELAGGQTLMAEGEAGDSMVIVVSGRLRAYVRQDDGSQRMVREMARGQVIGEMSLITHEPPPLRCGAWRLDVGCRPTSDPAGHRYGCGIDGRQNQGSFR